MNSVNINLGNINPHNKEKGTYLFFDGKFLFVGTSSGRIFYYSFEEEKFILCEDGIISPSPVVSIKSISDTKLSVEYEDGSTAISNDYGYTWDFAKRDEYRLNDLEARIHVLENKLKETDE